MDDMLMQCTVIGNMWIHQSTLTLESYLAMCYQ